MTFIFLLSGGEQVVGKAGGLGDTCSDEDPCQGDFVCINLFCEIPESQPPISERIATVIIS